MMTIYLFFNSGNNIYLYQEFFLNTLKQNKLRLTPYQYLGIHKNKLMFI